MRWLLPVEISVHKLAYWIFHVRKDFLGGNWVQCPVLSASLWEQLNSSEPWGTERTARLLRHPEDLHATAGALGPKTDAKLLEGKGQQHTKRKLISGSLLSPKCQQLGQGIAFLVDSLSLVDPWLFAMSLHPL